MVAALSSMPSALAESSKFSKRRRILSMGVEAVGREKLAEISWQLVEKSRQNSDFRGQISDFGIQISVGSGSWELNSRHHCLEISLLMTSLARRALPFLSRHIDALLEVPGHRTTEVRGMPKEVVRCPLGL